MKNTEEVTFAELLDSLGILLLNIFMPVGLQGPDVGTQITEQPTERKATASSREPAQSKLHQEQAAWDAKRQEIESWGDGLGRGIDEGIKETVVAFLVNGINTTASCEGHTDHGLATPWIDVAAPNQPDSRFVGEEAIYQRIAQERGVPVEDIKRWRGDKAKDAWWAVRDEAEKAGETPEYKEWREQTEQLGHQTEGLLDEFYADRQVTPGTRLYATQITDEGDWRVMAGTVEEHWADKPVRPPEETETLLLARRAEMAAFTYFLRSRYFSIESSSEANAVSKYVESVLRERFGEGVKSFALGENAFRYSSEDWRKVLETQFGFDGVELEHAVAYMSSLSEGISASLTYHTDHARDVKISQLQPPEIYFIQGENLGRFQFSNIYGEKGGVIVCNLEPISKPI